MSFIGPNRLGADSKLLFRDNVVKAPSQVTILSLIASLGAWIKSCFVPRYPERSGASTFLIFRNPGSPATQDLSSGVVYRRTPVPHRPVRDRSEPLVFKAVVSGSPCARVLSR